MYPAPAKIPQVYEPDGPRTLKPELSRSRRADEVLRTMSGTFARFGDAGSVNGPTDHLRVLVFNPQSPMQAGSFVGTISTRNGLPA